MTRSYPHSFPLVTPSMRSLEGERCVEAATSDDVRCGRRCRPEGVCEVAWAPSEDLSQRLDRGLHIAFHRGGLGVGVVQVSVTMTLNDDPLLIGGTQFAGIHDRQGARRRLDPSVLLPDPSRRGEHRASQSILTQDRRGNVQDAAVRIVERDGDRWLPATRASLHEGMQRDDIPVAGEERHLCTERFLGHEEFVRILAARARVPLRDT